MADDPTRSAPDLVGLDDAALAAALVGQAAARAARMRAEGVSARTKENLADLVTEADVAAERLVVDALTRLRPEDGVVGEEGTTRPSRSGRTWVIDPVDGTYNFATGTLYWCSALALRDADGVLVGAVEHRGAGESWLAVRGAGTFERGVAVPPLEDAPLSAVCLATYLHPANRHDEAIAARIRGMTERLGPEVFVRQNSVERKDGEDVLIYGPRQRSRGRPSAPSRTSYRQTRADGKERRPAKNGRRRGGGVGDQGGSRGHQQTT